MTIRYLKLQQYFGPVFVMVLFTLIGISGCEKLRQERWVRYDETVCADNWTFDGNNEKLKSNIQAYLEKKGIKVFEMEIFGEATLQTCTGCNCETGRTIRAKIKKNEVDDAKREGFYE